MSTALRAPFRVTRVYLSFRGGADARERVEGIHDVDAPDAAVAAYTFLKLVGARALDDEERPDGTLLVLGEDERGLFVLFTEPG